MTFNIDTIDQYKVTEIITIINMYFDLMTQNTQENLINKYAQLEPTQLGKIRQTLELMAQVKDSDVPTLQQMYNTMKNSLENYISQA